MKVNVYFTHICYMSGVVAAAAAAAGGSSSRGQQQQQGAPSVFTAQLRKLENLILILDVYKSGATVAQRVEQVD